MTSNEEVSVYGMADIIELLTQIRDKLDDMHDRLGEISGDTSDIDAKTGQSDDAVVAAIEEVGRKIESSTLDVLSSMPE